MKLPTYTKRDILGALKKMEAKSDQDCVTGFVISVTKEINARFYYSGSLILRTAVPKGRGDVSPGVQRAIRNQLKLDKEEFARFADCPMTLTDLINILKELNLIESNPHNNTPT